MRLFYFGCHDSIGHYLWGADGRAIQVDQRLAFERLCPFAKEVDGGLAPNDPAQLEGRARIHHDFTLKTPEGSDNTVPCWTAISWWDRSIDHRMGSHSTFVAVAPEMLSFDFMVTVARLDFPWIFKRFNYPVRLEGT